MDKSTVKPTLLCYLNGMPDVESQYPVLAAINRRGKINLEIIVYKKLMRKEPRLQAAFEDFGCIPKLGSKLEMKLAFFRAINRCDAILTIADPNRDTTTRSQRSWYAKLIEKPTIFLQHGAYQVGVNAGYEATPLSYYSQKLLLWEQLDPLQTVIAVNSYNRAEAVGFTKKSVLPIKAWSEDFLEWRAGYARCLLVCQSFRWGGGRFEKSDVDNFYNLVSDLANRNPDLGIIIRSHRGKVRKNHKQHDKELERRHSNVIFSRQYSGPMKGASIQDALSLCDAMISPSSTTVLDCIYSGKPAAVFDEGLSIFSELNQINTVSDIEAFLEDPNQNLLMDRLVNRFGQLEENLERAAEVIEQFMLEI